mmetsp:Transcript_23122/g.58398  ORF Transcript_23122/g.58398 Transcript_23122/m.58398 type:complete len:293 (-) Transcript_23122:591-1469(-)
MRTQRPPSPINRALIASLPEGGDPLRVVHIELCEGVHGDQHGTDAGVHSAPTVAWCARLATIVHLLNVCQHLGLVQLNQLVHVCHASTVLHPRQQILRREELGLAAALAVAAGARLDPSVARGELQQEGAVAGAVDEVELAAAEGPDRGGWQSGRGSAVLVSDAAQQPEDQPTACQARRRRHRGRAHRGERGDRRGDGRRGRGRCRCTDQVGDREQRLGADEQPGRVGRRQRAEAPRHFLSAEQAVTVRGVVPRPALAAWEARRLQASLGHALVLRGAVSSGRPGALQALRG